MPHAGASPGGANEDDETDTLQTELARLLSERVDEHMADPPRRRPHRSLRSLRGLEPPPAPVELDPAVVDAITLAVDRSIAALLPGLLEDAVARVLPAAVDTAVTDVVEALSPPAPPPAKRTRRPLRA